MAQQKSLKKNALFNSLCTLMGIIIPLITFPYTCRVLEPDGMGMLNYAVSVVSYFGLLASLGISTYGIREAAKIRDNYVLLNKLARELLIINLFSTVFAYSCLFASIYFVSKFFDYRVLFYIYSITIICNTLSLDWINSALEDYGFIALREFSISVLNILIMFVFLRKKEDYLLYSVMKIPVSILIVLVNVIHLRRVLFIKSKIKYEFKKHLKPIFIIFAMSITTSIYTMLDTLMLGGFCNDFEVGIYHAATKMNKMVITFVVSIGTVLLPRLSYYLNNDNRDEFNRLINKSFDVILLLSLPCAFGLNVLAKPVILLFSGDLYESAIWVSQVMNPIIVIISLGNLLGIQLFMPMNKEKLTLISVIFGAISNFIVNLLLIPRYGALGAAIASVVAEFCVTATQIIMASKFFSLKKLFKSFSVYFLNSLIMSIVVHFSIIKISNLFGQLFVGFIIGVCIYLILLLLEKNELVFSLLSLLRKKLKHKN